MSLTLGEKLRQARDERGFTLSEVAEQTRISSLYLESIERDDYSKLPGGIFNKGFVKSYAKFVGLNEQEALSDYSAVLARADISEETELKLYKPEVLTDDYRSGSSMAPTIIGAVVILSLMSVGVWFLVNYLRPSDDPVVANQPARNSSNANTESPSTSSEAPSDLPTMATLKVEFKTTTQPVRLIATSDGAKSDNVVAAGSTATFEPKESLTLNYNRWNATAVQLTINGKAIALPAAPLPGTADKSRIEFTINKNNLGQIWTSGTISAEAPPAAPADANVNANATSAPTVNTTPVTPAPTATKQPAANTPANRPATNTNTAPRPTPARPAATPAATPARPAANSSF
jgi:cytoskeletal protein RodZ